MLRKQPSLESKQLTFEALEYKPTPEQWKIHKALTRVLLIAGGERSGKSEVTSDEATPRLFYGKLFWLVGAEYDATRPEFTYICRNLTKLGINYLATKQVNPGEILIEGGIRVVTKSARDPRKLAMEAPDGIVIVEAAQVDYETFLRCRGRVAEKRGWLIMSGTFESSLGWYPELFERWLGPNDEEAKSFSLPTWSNLVIYPGGRQDPEILALELASSEDWFLERYGGVPCPPKGRVFTEFRTTIHVNEEAVFDPLIPCQIWIDPGYAHAYAVEVVQKKGDDVQIVDEVFERGLVTSDIITVCKQKPWWNMVSGGAIDIAGTQHQAMPAPREIWLKEAGIPLRSKKIRIQDGIERLKAALKVNPIVGRPQLTINPRCKGLISELGGCPNPITNRTAVYSWKIDRENMIIGDVPEDKNNDATKATIYGLVDMLGYTYAQGQTKAKIDFF